MSRIHPTAVIDPQAQLPDDIEVGDSFKIARLILCESSEKMQEGVA